MRCVQKLHIRLWSPDWLKDENVICTDEDEELTYFEHLPCFILLGQFSRSSSWFGIFYVHSWSNPDIVHLLRAGPLLSMQFRLFLRCWLGRLWSVDYTLLMVGLLGLDLMAEVEWGASKSSTLDRDLRTGSRLKMLSVSVKMKNLLVLNTFPVLSFLASLVVPALGLGFWIHTLAPIRISLLLVSPVCFAPILHFRFGVTFVAMPILARTCGVRFPSGWRRAWVKAHDEKLWWVVGLCKMYWIEFRKMKAKFCGDEKVEEKVLGRLQYSKRSENVWSY